MIRRQSGDTLVEVLLGIVVLSVVVVGGISLMTFGLAQAQNAVEHTQVRTQINSQSSALAYLRDDYTRQNRTPSAGSPGSVWKDILTNYVVNTAPTSKTDDCVPQNHPFYLKLDLAQTPSPATIVTTFVPPTTYAQPGQGLWVEGYHAVGTSGQG